MIHLATSATLIGYVLIWFAFDAPNATMLAGVCGGMLFGGGLAVGLLGSR